MLGRMHLLANEPPRRATCSSAAWRSIRKNIDLKAALAGLG